MRFQLRAETARPSRVLGTQSGGRETAGVWMSVSSIVLDHNSRSVASTQITAPRSRH